MIIAFWFSHIECIFLTRIQSFIDCIDCIQPLIGCMYPSTYGSYMNIGLNMECIFHCLCLCIHHCILPLVVFVVQTNTMIHVVLVAQMNTIDTSYIRCANEYNEHNLKCAHEYRKYKLLSTHILLRVVNMKTVVAPRK